MNRRCPTGLRAAGCRCGAGRRRGRRRRRGGRGRGGSGRVATGAAAASGLVRQVVDTNTTAKLLGELDDICERKKKKKKSQLARKRQRGIVSVVPFVWSIVHLSSRQQATPIRNFLSSQAHLASKSWQWSGVPPVPQSFCIAIYRLANDTARQHKAGEWNDNIQHIGGGWRKSPEQQRQSHRPGKERRIGTS